LFRKHPHVRFQRKIFPLGLKITALLRQRLQGKHQEGVSSIWVCANQSDCLIVGV
jgi:hypothetical protein